MVLRMLDDMFPCVVITVKKNFYDSAAAISFAKSDDKKRRGMQLIYSTEEISYMTEKHHGEFHKKIVDQQMNPFYGEDNAE